MKRPSKKQSVAAGIVLVFALTAFGIWQYRQNPSPIGASAISSDVRQSIDFTLYMPRQLPSGFLLDREKGVSYSGGVLFTQFKHDDQTIFMSQQKKPDSTPSLNTLKGFTPLEISIGTAVYGEQDGNAATLILTDTSLITITSDGTVPTSDLNLVAKRLQKI